MSMPAHHPVAEPIAGVVSLLHHLAALISPVQPKLREQVVAGAEDLQAAGGEALPEAKMPASTALMAGTSPAPGRDTPASACGHRPGFGPSSRGSMAPCNAPSGLDGCDVHRRLGFAVVMLRIDSSRVRLAVVRAEMAAVLFQPTSSPKLRGPVLRNFERLYDEGGLWHGVDEARAQLRQALAACVPLKGRDGPPQVVFACWVRCGTSSQVAETTALEASSSSGNAPRCRHEGRARRSERPRSGVNVSITSRHSSSCAAGTLCRRPSGGSSSSQTPSCSVPWKASRPWSYDLNCTTDIAARACFTQMACTASGMKPGALRRWRRGG
jgi:hypothetical protein